MLINQIQKAQVTARKNKEQSRASFLTTLLSEARRVGFDDGKRESTDEEVLKVIKSFVKNVKFNIEKAGSSDQTNMELSILESFMPQQMSEDELRSIITGYVSSMGEVSMKQMGSIMGKLKGEHDGKYDGQMASKIVREVISAS